LAQKKTEVIPITQKRELIDRDGNELSIDRQCQLIDLNRSTLYYESSNNNALELAVKREIDEIYTLHPYYGSRRMRWMLNKRGYNIGRERVVTLMRSMGIQAIYAKPKLTVAHPGHKIYPYLLRGIKVTKKDHVWSTDITYIRMRSGFLYLTAVIDWASRYVLAWRLSNSLEGTFCREAVQESLTKGKPQIFNTDQGSQFTSMEFTDVLECQGIRVSMDGRGRALDNVFVERLWRSVKQEEVYLKDYLDGIEAHNSLKDYFKFYNESRPHSSLGYITPMRVYKGENVIESNMNMKQ
jgi:putative transposase